MDQVSGQEQTVVDSKTDEATEHANEGGIVITELEEASWEEIELWLEENLWI